MPGTLFVVATPIGNLEDITLRALRVLKEVTLIAAEDTRVTRKLLSRYEIHTPLTAYHQHSRGERAEQIATRLSHGESVALVSDAGMPGVSDPGAELISLAIAAGIPVVPIPGPNAALSALIVSGLPMGRFVFEGFPPRTKNDRRAFFDALRAESRTLIIYESPGRILGTLEDLYSVMGDRSVAVARELTKVFEEVYRGSVSGAIATLQAKRPRGEFTVVVGPPATDSNTSSTLPNVRQQLAEALASGLSRRDAVMHVSVRLNLPRRLVYRALLDLVDDLPSPSCNP